MTSPHHEIMKDLVEIFNNIAWLFLGLKVCYALALFKTKQILHCKQCDQIGLLLKRPGDIFSYQINPNIGQLFVLFYKPLFMRKNFFGSFLGNFVWNWATFNSSIWSHWLQGRPKDWKRNIFFCRKRDIKKWRQTLQFFEHLLLLLRRRRRLRG